MCATGQCPPKKLRSREEPVFATDTEVQWMQDPTDAKMWMRERQAVGGGHSSGSAVCREVGATVRCNCKLPDMDIACASHDERAVEVLAAGLPFRHGAQLAVDIALRSVLTAAQRAPMWQWSMEQSAGGPARTRNGSILSCWPGTDADWSWLHWRLAEDGVRKPCSCRRFGCGQSQRRVTFAQKICILGLEEEVLPHDRDLVRHSVREFSRGSTSPHTLACVDDRMPDLVVTHACCQP